MTVLVGQVNRLRHVPLSCPITSFGGSSTRDTSATLSACCIGDEAEGEEVHTLELHGRLLRCLLS